MAEYYDRPSPCGRFIFTQIGDEAVERTIAEARAVVSECLRRALEAFKTHPGGIAQTHYEKRAADLERAINLDLRKDLS